MERARRRVRTRAVGSRDGLCCSTRGRGSTNGLRRPPERHRTPTFFTIGSGAARRARAPVTTIRGMPLSARTAPPPANVMRAFGGYGDPESLPGGENPAWRVGNVVLKRVDVPIAQLEWQASLFDSLQAQAAFRVPTAVRSGDGGLSVNGWYGTKFLRGRHEPARWIDIVNAGEAFHAAVSSVPRPAFLNERNDPWRSAIEWPGATYASTTYLRRSTWIGCWRTWCPSRGLLN